MGARFVFGAIFRGIAFAFGWPLSKPIVGPVQAESAPSFTSPQNLVKGRVFATVRDVNPKKCIRINITFTIGFNAAALRLM